MRISINFQAPSIAKASSLIALLPENFSAPLPVFYLLHGLSDDHTVWSRGTAIERYMVGIPCIVVMPDGHRSWYTNSAIHPGLAYEDHIIKDVIGLVDRLFPTVKSREGRAIGGLSMGGYGAVKLGLKYPQLFGSITSHSGALARTRLRPNAKMPDAFVHAAPEFFALMGSKKQLKENDCFHLAEKLPAKNRPALRIDCGTEDFLLADNRAFHQHLTKLKFAHEYAEFPGNYNWDYWEIQIREAINFHRKILNF